MKKNTLILRTESTGNTDAAKTFTCSSQEADLELKSDSRSRDLRHSSQQDMFCGVKRKRPQQYNF